jgi:rRNA-processing protein FCF1
MGTKGRIELVVFDTTFLLLLVDENTPIPRDPSTGKPWIKGRDRVEYLIDRLSAAKTQVLIPTPVMAEVLVRAGAAIPDYLAKIRAIHGFRIGNFDQKAAVEVALMTGAALSRGSKRAPARSLAPWQRVKLDRQIVAIAKAEGAVMLYTDDDDLKALATNEHLSVSGIGELPIRPEDPQQNLELIVAGEK